ncbi:hypothetical protein TNCV_2148641 [Trichonephila clavipes]|nr:hypothetical protein TNCV_2148641 [Trichonephila clavipes]
MSKYLPLKDFVWSDNDLTEQDILNLSDESDVGYILEVDLEYPSDLHDKHSDFPLAPENKPPHLIQQERTTQLGSRNETTQLVSRNETTQLNRRKQLNSSVGTKQLNSALPSTAYNRLQPPTTAYDRLQPPAPPAPPAPPLQQNRLFLPTNAHLHSVGHFSILLKDCQKLIKRNVPEEFQPMTKKGGIN